MSITDKRLFLCNCNGTLPLDAEALARVLELASAPTVQGQLCQKEIASLLDAEGDCLVACTQEAERFREAAEGGKPQSITFFNIREAGGWSK
ncbi:MAG TPA: 4Fe-4S ferredoxin, partial [Casimicrobiaceae bacterium]|nr:4Fe-4S ferredoxin [Casimicrobiaceae bacterium]